MAEKNKIQDDRLYTELKTFPKRRFTLWTLVLFTFFIYTGIIFGEVTLGHHWSTMSFPIILWGIFLIIYPITEEWEYTAWQSEPEKQEQTFFN